MDERHDVITAEDMKQALESHGGLRGCRAAVVEVDTTKAVGNDNKIPGISLIKNSLFEEGGIRTWKAYNVGPGRYLAYDELSFEKQGDTGLKVIQPFSPRTKDRGTVLESTSLGLKFSLAMRLDVCSLLRQKQKLMPTRMQGSTSES